MRNFRLTEETLEVFGVKVYRIECTRDSLYAKKGSLGGFVENEYNITDNGWVKDNAVVIGNARVTDHAVVIGNARVTDNAVVTADAVVSDRAQVSGDARITDRAIVSGKARIAGNAVVGGKAVVTDGSFFVSPFQFGGTMHYVNECGPGVLRIGCMKYTLNEWKKIGREKAIENGYSEKQIMEYGLYIDLYEKLNSIDSALD